MHLEREIATRYDEGLSEISCPNGIEPAKTKQSSLVFTTQRKYLETPPGERLKSVAGLTGTFGPRLSRGTPTRELDQA